jgi:ribosomal protein S18 acetylase RimI-like enzyme
MTDRTWHLYWIAVLKGQQGRGLGGELLHHVEADVRARGGRLLVIETSSTPHYEPTRRFYLKHGCTQSAVIHDFYADGDGMVVFTARLDALRAS